MNELRNLLIQVNGQGQKNPEKKREVIKKVIAYMTLGYDVSKLFSEIVMACSTSDMIVKKMCYLYLSAYAKSNPELATLCINTMTKDCKDHDPLVRGLALRSLSSLKLVSMVEYIIPALKAGLSDTSGYVRRNAILAVLKLYHLKADYVRDENLVDKLYSLLTDRDGEVVVACIVVLDEVMMDEGGFAITQQILHHLLNRIKSFNEWGQCVILKLVAKYRPREQKEMFAIMNLLDGCLRYNNSAVVVATTKCFLRYAETMPTLKEQIYKRVKQPLITLIASKNHEVRFATLNHVALIVSRCPGIFDDAYKQFYCHYSEPVGSKYVKLEIMPEVANEDNLKDIINELCEYVTDTNTELAKRALAAMGRIGIKITAGADFVMNRLLEFMDMDIDYVRSGSLVVAKDMIRKYDDRAEDYIVDIPRALRRVEDPRGKAAAVWIIGEFGAGLDEAPYLLEKLIDGICSGESESAAIKMQLLVAVAKMFFARPPECVRMLGRYLDYLLNTEDVDADLRDRALLYYRLLKASPAEAERVIACEKDIVTTFSEERDAELKQAIFEEYNTLSVVYRKPAEEFVDDEYRETKVAALDLGGDFGLSSAGEFVDGPSATSAVAGDAGDAVEGDLLGGWDDFGGANASGAEGGDASLNSNVNPLDDLLGLSSSSGTSQQQGGWQLAPRASITQAEFIKRWKDPSAKKLGGIQFTAGIQCTQPQPIEQALERACIMTMANGDLGSQFKFYFYAADNAGDLFLAEVFCEKSTGKVAMEIRGFSADDMAFLSFQGVVEGALRG